MPQTLKGHKIPVTYGSLKAATKLAKLIQSCFMLDTLNLAPFRVILVITAKSKPS